MQKKRDNLCIWFVLWLYLVIVCAEWLLRLDPETAFKQHRVNALPSEVLLITLCVHGYQKDMIELQCNTSIEVRFPLWTSSGTPPQSWWSVVHGNPMFTFDIYQPSNLETWTLRTWHIWRWIAELRCEVQHAPVPCMPPSNGMHGKKCVLGRWATVDIKIATNPILLGIAQRPIARDLLYQVVRTPESVRNDFSLPADQKEELLDLSKIQSSPSPKLDGGLAARFVQAIDVAGNLVQTSATELAQLKLPAWRKFHIHHSSCILYIYNVELHCICIYL